MTTRSTRRGSVGDSILRAAWDTVDAAVVVLDADGVARYANRAAMAILEWEDEPLGDLRLDVTRLVDTDGGATSDIVLQGRRARCRRFNTDEGCGWVLQLTTDEHGDDGDAARARTDETQQLLVSQLQEAIRPPRPSLPEIDLGVWYQAADATQPTGGDLYDWYLLPDGDLHLLVVDVMGKGIAATKDALAVVHTIRTLVLEQVPLETVVQRADELLTPAHPTLVATVLVARYQPHTGRLVIADGGHPPVLIVRSDGEVQEIPADGIPIGWPGAGSFALAEVELARSDTAIFYTDGLIEARSDILVGLRDLKAAAAATIAYPARDLPRILVERSLAGAGRRDDAVALAVRRRSAPTNPARHLRLPPFEYRLGPSHAAVGLARLSLAEWLAYQGVEDRESADLCLVASELCANAVDAARTVVVLRAHADCEAVIVEVEDDGDGFELSTAMDDDRPSRHLERGRGLFVASALIDDIAVHHDETTGRTIVSVRRESVLAASVDLGDVPSAPQTAPSSPTLGFAVDAAFEGARICVILRGELDSYSAPRLAGAFDICTAGGRHLVVDLALVTFIDSTGLDALVRELTKKRADGAVVSVRGASPQTMMLFELTGFGSLFDVS